MSSAGQGKVYPTYFPKNLNLIAKSMVEGFITGLHKSPYHGFSVEFNEHYPYNMGDNTRNIDWKLFARSDKLFIKRYQEDTNLRCYFLLDTSSSMNFPLNAEISKKSFSIFCIASLIYLLKKQRDAFALGLFDKNRVQLSASASTQTHKNHIYSLLEQNLKLQDTGVKTNLIECLENIAIQIPGRSLVILFSDFFDHEFNSNNLNEFKSVLKYLKYRKQDMIFFHIHEKNMELDFVFNNSPYEFQDLETGGKVKLHPMQVKKNYQSLVNTFLSDIKSTCLKLNFDYQLVDINQSIQEVLSLFLIKRHKLNK